MSLCKLMDDASIAHTNAIIEFEFYFIFFLKTYAVHSCSHFTHYHADIYWP